MGSAVAVESSNMDHVDYETLKASGLAFGEAHNVLQKSTSATGIVLLGSDDEDEKDNDQGKHQTNDKDRNGSHENEADHKTVVNGVNGIYFLAIRQLSVTLKNQKPMRKATNKILKSRSVPNTSRVGGDEDEDEGKQNADEFELLGGDVALRYGSDDEEFAHDGNDYFDEEREEEEEEEEEEEHDEAMPSLSHVRIAVDVLPSTATTPTGSTLVVYDTSSNTSSTGTGSQSAAVTNDGQQATSTSSSSGGSDLGCKDVPNVGINTDPAGGGGGGEATTTTAAAEAKKPPQVAAAAPVAAGAGAGKRKKPNLMIQLTKETSFNTPVEAVILPPDAAPAAVELNPFASNAPTLNNQNQIISSTGTGTSTGIINSSHNHHHRDSRNARNGMDSSSSNNINSMSGSVGGGGGGVMPLSPSADMSVSPHGTTLYMGNFRVGETGIAANESFLGRSSSSMGKSFTFDRQHVLASASTGTLPQAASSMNASTATTTTSAAAAGGARAGASISSGNIKHHSYHRHHSSSSSSSSFSGQSTGKPAMKASLRGGGMGSSGVLNKNGTGTHHRSRHHTHSHHHHHSQSNAAMAAAVSALPAVGGGKNDFVEINTLGSGASGVVTEAIHLPSLTLVALKMLPVYNQEKRQHVSRELGVLYKNLAELHLVNSSLYVKQGQQRRHPFAAVKEGSKASTTGSSSNQEAKSEGKTGDDEEEEEVVAGRGSARKNSNTGQGKSSPHVVSLYNAFVDPKSGMINLVIEYMDGGSLEDLVQAGGCRDEQVLADIAYQTCKGLCFLHNNKSVHRDIKPANILCSTSGLIKIADFGIAKALDKTSGFANSFVGTVCYMSPERITGESYSYACDIWSLGLTLLAVAKGRFPLNTKDDGKGNNAESVAATSAAAGASSGTAGGGGGKGNHLEDVGGPVGGAAGYWALIQAICDEEPPRAGSSFTNVFNDFISHCLCKTAAERHTAKQLLESPFIENNLGSIQLSTSDLQIITKRQRHSEEKSTPSAAMECKMGEETALSISLPQVDGGLNELQVQVPYQPLPPSSPLKARLTNAAIKRRVSKELPHPSNLSTKGGGGDRDAMSKPRSRSDDQHDNEEGDTHYLGSAISSAVATAASASADHKSEEGAGAAVTATGINRAQAKEHSPPSLTDRAGAGAGAGAGAPTTAAATAANGTGMGTGSGEPDAMDVINAIRLEHLDRVLDRIVRRLGGTSAATRKANSAAAAVTPGTGGAGAGGGGVGEVAEGKQDDDEDDDDDDDDDVDDYDAEGVHSYSHSDADAKVGDIVTAAAKELEGKPDSKAQQPAPSSRTSSRMDSVEGMLGYDSSEPSPPPLVLPSGRVKSRTPATATSTTAVDATVVVPMAEAKDDSSNTSTHHVGSSNRDMKASTTVAAGTGGGGLLSSKSVPNVGFVNKTAEVPVAASSAGTTGTSSTHSILKGSASYKAEHVVSASTTASATSSAGAAGAGDAKSHVEAPRDAFVNKQDDSTSYRSVHFAEDDADAQADAQAEAALVQGSLPVTTSVESFEDEEDVVSSALMHPTGMLISSSKSDSGDAGDAANRGGGIATVARGGKRGEGKGEGGYDSDENDTLAVSDQVVLDAETHFSAASAGSDSSSRSSSLLKGSRRYQRARRGHRDQQHEKQPIDYKLVLPKLNRRGLPKWESLARQLHLPLHLVKQAVRSKLQSIVNLEEEEEGEEAALGQAMQDAAAVPAGLEEKEEEDAEEPDERPPPAAVEM